MANLRSDMEQVSREQVEQFFSKVIKALNNSKVDYWVEFGTLLGLIREGGLLKNDSDIDIVVIGSLLDESVKNIINECSKVGLRGETQVIHGQSPKIKIVDPSISNRHCMHAEVFYLDINQESKPMYHWVYRQKILSRLANTFYIALTEIDPVKNGVVSINAMATLMSLSSKLPKRLRRIVTKVFFSIDSRFCEYRTLVFPFEGTEVRTFYNQDVKVPKNPENHLLLNYGHLWGVPKSGFMRGGSEFQEKIGRNSYVCSLSEKHDKV